MYAKQNSYLEIPGVCQCHLRLRARRHRPTHPQTFRRHIEIPRILRAVSKDPNLPMSATTGKRIWIFYGVGGGSWVSGWMGSLRNVTTYLAGRCVADVLCSCTGKAKRRGYKVRSRQNDFRPPSSQHQEYFHFHLTSQTLIKAACHNADRQTQKQRTEKDVIRKTKWYHTRTSFIKRLLSPLPHTHTSTFFFSTSLISLPHQANEDTPIVTYYHTAVANEDQV